MATQSLTHTMGFSDVSDNYAAFEIDPSTTAIFSVAAVATAFSHQHCLKPTVKLPSLAVNSSRELRGASIARRPAVTISSPTLTTQNEANSSTAEGTNTRKTNSSICVAEGADSGHLMVYNNLQSSLPKSRWADDIDLAPISGLEEKPNRDSIQKPSQEGFKGLKHSRWANNDDQPSTPAVRSTLNKNVSQQRSGKSFKGLASSRWAGNSQSQDDKHMSEDKLKRELARFGLKNARSTNNTSLYSQLPFQPHSPRKPNYERGWNNTKQPRTSYHNYHQATVKYEPPREVPHLLIDRKEFHQDFQQYDLKTLLDSRLADKKENETPKKTYGLIMDWEEFHREVKQFGLKTLKDSRWA